MTSEIDQTTGSRFAWALLVLLLAGMSLGVVAALYAEKLLHEDSAAPRLIVLVFSIFTGFLISATVSVADPVAMPPGSWRRAWFEGSLHVQRKLVQYTLLLYIYLITLGLILAATLLDQAAPRIVAWLQRGYLFFAVGGFILTFGLPLSWRETQRDRWMAEIDRRREEDRRQQARGVGGYPSGGTPTSMVAKGNDC